MGEGSPSSNALGFDPDLSTSLVNGKTTTRAYNRVEMVYARGPARFAKMMVWIPLKPIIVHLLRENYSLCFGTPGLLAQLQSFKNSIDLEKKTNPLVSI